MMMTNEEIARSYKEAKNKYTQVLILAELNDCDKQTIIDILEATGMEAPKMPNKRMARIKTQIATGESSEKKGNAISEETNNSEGTEGVPPVVMETLTEKLISITEEIDSLTKKANEIKSYIRSIGQQA